jgi:hypothetical protein
MKARHTEETRRKLRMPECRMRVPIRQAKIGVSAVQEMGIQCGISHHHALDL